MGGQDRKTLKAIPYYPTPKEISDLLMESKGWHYRRDVEKYLKRDRALVAVLYLGGLRISEALKLKKSQFVKRRDHVLVRSIKLSKSRVKGKPRRIEYRDARLPLNGDRSDLTKLVIDYLETLEEKDTTLFRFGNTRAWQIVTGLLPSFTCHWLRAFCEDYLYDAWDHDLLAVSDYVKVDPRTLELYLRKRHERYPVA
jgi:integrase